MSLSGTSSCYGNQSILTAEGKTTALRLLKWPFHFIWPSKLKLTVPFHWSTTYATYRHGPNEENGDADGENSIFLVCSYFLFLHVWHLLFSIQLLCISICHKSQHLPHSSAWVWRMFWNLQSFLRKGSLEKPLLWEVRSEPLKRNLETRIINRCKCHQFLFESTISSISRN